MRTASGGMPRIAGNIGAVHVGGLGAGLNLDLVADTACKTGLRFDVGVLDEAGLVFVLDDDVRFGKSLLDIATDHASPDQHIVFAGRVDAFGRQVPRASSIVVSAGSSSQVTGNVERSRASTISASPTTAAIGSPRNRASASAKTG